MGTILRFKDLAPLRQSLAARRIVWTNGVFDLLHAGHLQSLQAAKRLGDVLVVGINSDSSAARIKPGRPIIGDRDRAELLADLRCVDYVVIYSESEPLACIEQLRPDVLAKGAEYDGRRVPGADLVASWGGRLEWLPMVSGVSTSEVIRRCRTLPEFS